MWCAARPTTISSGSTSEDVRAFNPGTGIPYGVPEQEVDMRDIDICPSCGGPVIGYGEDQRCTECGLTFEEMAEEGGFDDGENPDEW